MTEDEFNSWLRYGSGALHVAAIFFPALCPLAAGAAELVEVAPELEDGVLRIRAAIEGNGGVAETAHIQAAQVLVQRHVTQRNQMSD